MQKIVEIRVKTVKGVYKNSREAVEAYREEMREYMEGILQSFDNSSGVHGPEGFNVEKWSSDVEGVFLLCKSKKRCTPICICENIIYVQSGMAKHITDFLKEDAISYDMNKEPRNIPAIAERLLGNA